MDEQLELEADIQQEMAASRRLRRGRHGLRREARPRVHRAPDAAHAARAPDRLARRLESSRALPAVPPPVAAAPCCAAARARWSLAGRRARRRRRRPSPAGRRTPTRSTRSTRSCSYVAIVVFVGVEGALLYSLINSAPAEAPCAADPGQPPLEIGWTVGASPDPRRPGGRDLRQLPGHPATRRARPGAASSAARRRRARRRPARPAGRQVTEHPVNGQQYVWRYDLPESQPAASRYEEMVVPTNTTVTLKIRRQDVATPGGSPSSAARSTRSPATRTRPGSRSDEPGAFRGQCAELCGAQPRRHVARCAPCADQYRPGSSARRRHRSPPAAALAAQRWQPVADPAAEQP